MKATRTRKASATEQNARRHLEALRRDLKRWLVDTGMGGDFSPRIVKSGIRRMGLRHV